MDDNILYRVHSKLTEIPKIEENITRIDIRRNLISEMSFHLLPQVEYLDISDNRIKTIKNLENLPNLRIFDVSYNLLTDFTIPKSDITELYLIGNDIKEISPLNLKDLKKLDLAVNLIKKIGNLEKCLKLEELYLGSNKIEEMGDLRQFNSLRVLDLQNNLLSRVDCSLLPKSLTTLLLADNSNLTEISNLECLSSLRILGIERTGIKKSSTGGSINGSIGGLEVWY